MWVRQCQSFTGKKRLSLPKCIIVGSRRAIPYENVKNPDF